MTPDRGAVKCSTFCHFQQFQLQRTGIIFCLLFRFAKDKAERTTSAWRISVFSEKYNKPDHPPPRAAAARRSLRETQLYAALGLAARHAPPRDKEGRLCTVTRTRKAFLVPRCRRETFPSSRLFESEMALFLQKDNYSNYQAPPIHIPSRSQSMLFLPFPVVTFPVKSTPPFAPRAYVVSDLFPRALSIQNKSFA